MNPGIGKGAKIAFLIISWAWSVGIPAVFQQGITNTGRMGRSGKRGLPICVRALHDQISDTRRALARGQNNGVRREEETFLMCIKVFVGTVYISLGIVWCLGDNIEIHWKT